MSIIIKPMETDEEINGKAYVHWKCWQVTYPGLVSQEYLDKLTLTKCEEMAFRWRDNILVAKDGDRVVGFVGYGGHAPEEPDMGEVYALYVKGNGRAVRFYEKCGFRLTGEEVYKQSVSAYGIRMLMER